MTQTMTVQQRANSSHTRAWAVVACALLVVSGMALAESSGGETTDGARLVASLHRPAGDGPFPAVLLLMMVITTLGRAGAPAHLLRTKG